MSEHTPGPWAVNPVRAQVDALDPRHGPVPVCRLLWPTERRTEEETEANARLIAAAPDMAQEIEALRAELAEARRDAESLREKAELYLGDARRWQSAVMKAPHDPLCATRGELGPCNCWKRAAIDATRGEA